MAEVGHTDVEDLSLLFQPVQGIHGLFKGGIGIRTVDQHEIDIIRLQIFQGFLNLAKYGIIAPVPQVPRVMVETFMPVLPNRLYFKIPPPYIFLTNRFALHIIVANGSILKMIRAYSGLSDIFMSESL